METYINIILSFDMRMDLGIPIKGTTWKEKKIVWKKPDAIWYLPNMQDRALVIKFPLNEKVNTVRMQS